MSLEDLLGEARSNLSRTSEGVSRFENERLLDGLGLYSSGQLSLEGVSMVLDCLFQRFGIDIWKIEKVANSYLANELGAMMKSRGFTRELIDPESMNTENRAKGTIYAAVTQLCKSGALLQVKEESYQVTPKLWKAELSSLREKITKLILGLNSIIDKKSTNYDEVDRELQALLEDSIAVARELTKLNELRIAKAIQRKSQGLDMHIHKHHPGPWVPNMVLEYRNAIQSDLAKLPPEFSG